MERLRDSILQFAASWSLDQGGDGRESLESSFKISQKHATEHGDETTDEERPQLVVSMSPEVDDNNDAREERLRRSLDSSTKADVDDQTNAERLLRALAMLMDENVSDGIGSFKATSIEPDEDNETNEERFQRALAMSMVDENDCE